MELLDVYNDNGERTGRVVERGTSKDSFSKEEHIAVAIIFIENSNHEFLIQKTSKEKGGHYSSTGGHVDHNEKPMDSIKREVQEELGIDIYHDEIIDLGFLLFDFPIRFVFYLKKDISLDDIVTQKEEVENVYYMKEEEIKDLIQKGRMLESHGRVFDTILKYKER